MSAKINPTIATATKTVLLFMKSLRKTILSGLTAWICSTALAGNLAAHDFWIEPSPFRAAVGEPVQLTLRVGQDFSGDSLPYITDWFSDYRVKGPQKEYPIEAIIGDDPAGEFTTNTPGYYAVGYRSTVNFVELEPVKFKDYLAAEGLTAIIESRDENDEAETNGREIYSRCAKSLIKIGDPDPASRIDTVFGYTLELVAETNPYILTPGDALTVQLLYESEPLEDALVIAFTNDRPEDKQQVRTNEDGRARLELPHSGIWLVKAVHMIPTPPSDQQADWESFWASLTFFLPPA
jgi:uncharacterized GH25 family protein